MNTLRTILVVFGVLVIGAITLQYFQTKNMVIEGFNDGCPAGEPCPKGCNRPTQITGNCSQIYKEDDGRCYKLCPFECTDPMSECGYDECCEGCGKVKIYVDCKTGEALNMGPDLNDPTQETNYAASSINTGTTNSSKRDIQGSVLDDEARDTEVAANTAQTSVQNTQQTTPSLKHPKKSSANQSPSQQPSTQQPQSQQQQTTVSGTPSTTTSAPTVIEYHNHYYGMIPSQLTAVDTRLSQMSVPLVDSVTKQKGTPNPYRQGGDISDNVDNQTGTMEHGLSRKQDASTVMNYGTYGTPKTSNAVSAYSAAPSQTLSTTGMFVEDTTPGFNSLYSMRF